jgi:hypothetical protein
MVEPTRACLPRRQPSAFAEVDTSGRSTCGAPLDHWLAGTRMWKRPRHVRRYGPALIVLMECLCPIHQCSSASYLAAIVGPT